MSSKFGVSANVNASVGVFFVIEKRSVVFFVFEKKSGVFGEIVRDCVCDCVCDCDSSRVGNLSNALPILVRLQSGNSVGKVACVKEACRLTYSFWNLRAISNAVA